MKTFIKYSLIIVVAVICLMVLMIGGVNIIIGEVERGILHIAISTAVLGVLICLVGE